jgi:hypothetical protein
MSVETEQTLPPTMTPESAYARLQAWYIKQQELSTLKVAEVLDRKDLAAYYFTAPREGTNRLDIGGGYELKLDHKFNYKVDEGAVDNVAASEIKNRKLPWDDLFDYKPTLNMKTYRKLTAEQKAFVDGLLEITDATPALSIVPAADTAGQQKHVEAARAEVQLQVVAFVEVQDPDDAQPGNYYCDDEGQWWHVKEDGEWEHSIDPNTIVTTDAPAPAKPKRTRAKKGV